jgi:hypothetical protein
MKYNAIIRFLAATEGGRISPPMTGYKPHVKIGGEHTSCIITPKDLNEEMMGFEIDHDVFLELRFENDFIDKVDDRLNIGLYEGNGLVGHGYLYGNEQ